MKSWYKYQYKTINWTRSLSLKGLKEYGQLIDLLTRVSMRNYNKIFIKLLLTDALESYHILRNHITSMHPWWYIIDNSDIDIIEFYRDTCVPFRLKRYYLYWFAIGICDLHAQYIMIPVIERVGLYFNF